MKKTSLLILFVFFFFNLTSINSNFESVSSEFKEDKVLVGVEEVNDFLSNVLSLDVSKGSILDTEVIARNIYSIKGENIQKRIYAYDQHIEFLRDNYSVEELQTKFGYDLNQANSIENFDYSFDGRTQASATVRLYLYYYNYRYNLTTNKTSISLETNGYINGFPFNEIGNRKTIALAVTGSNSQFMMSEEPYFSSFYTHDGGVTGVNLNYTSSSVGKTPYPGLGVVISFPSYITELNGLSGGTRRYLSRFTARYHGIATNDVNVASMRSTMAYRTLSLGASIGIEFSQTPLSLQLTIKPHWAIELDIIRTIQR